MGALKSLVLAPLELAIDLLQIPHLPGVDPKASLVLGSLDELGYDAPRVPVQVLTKTPQRPQ